MALSGGLERAGTPPSRVATQATCIMDTVAGGARITTIRLEVRAKVPGADPAGFQKAAETAKDNCPVSQALKGNVAIELDARLE
jgi:osmotically inducible protein OsmC